MNFLGKRKHTSNVRYIRFNVERALSRTWRRYVYVKINDYHGPLQTPIKGHLTHRIKDSESFERLEVGAEILHPKPRHRRRAPAPPRPARAVRDGTAPTSAAPLSITCKYDTGNPGKRRPRRVLRSNSSCSNGLAVALSLHDWTNLSFVKKSETENNIAVHTILM